MAVAIRDLAELVGLTAKQLEKLAVRGGCRIRRGETGRRLARWSELAAALELGGQQSGDPAPERRPRVAPDAQRHHPAGAGPRRRLGLLLVALPARSLLAGAAT